MKDATIRRVGLHAVALSRSSHCNSPWPARRANIRSHSKPRAILMRRIAPVIAFLAALIVPAFAQKAEIEAVNAKWIECFNRGDFFGVASLYIHDAHALQ